MNFYPRTNAGVKISLKVYTFQVNLKFGISLK